MDNQAHPYRKPKMTVEDVIKFCNKQFDDQSPILPLWQTMADNFFPQRGEFTRVHTISHDFADTTVDSYPIIARRDLANNVGSVLRDGKWFDMGAASSSGRISKRGSEFLEDCVSLMFKGYNDRRSGFARTVTQGDNDFVTFGQTVMSCNLDRRRRGLLFQSWNLRDCAWWDDDAGNVEGVCRKWKPFAKTLVDYFPKTCDARIKEICKKDPLRQLDCFHVIMPSEMYGDENLMQYKYVSLYIDKLHNTILEELGTNHKHYIVPRWELRPGSQYAVSPATIAALPNSRLLQSMMFTLLEAGERYTRPPIAMAEGKVRSDIDLTGNGITYLDLEQGEKIRDIMSPIYQDMSGWSIGDAMRNDVIAVINSAFYLDRLSLPDTGREMTAFEVRERMKAYRRENLPLFTPMESDYNGQICELSFNIMLDAGFFGSKYDIPRDLIGQDIEFKFRSPLSRQEEELNATKFSETMGLIRESMEIAPQVADNIDFNQMFRDAVDGLDNPEKWKIDIEQVLQTQESRAMQAAQQQIMEQAALEANIA